MSRFSMQLFCGCGDFDDTPAHRRMIARASVLSKTEPTAAAFGQFNVDYPKIGPLPLRNGMEPWWRAAAVFASPYAALRQADR